MVIIQEHTSNGYRDRTFFNAESGDVTLALAVDFSTAGEKLTQKAAGDRFIGFKLTQELTPIHVARELYAFMREKNAKTINIAGNGIYTLNKNGFDQLAITAFLCDVLEIINRQKPIERIFSGGQTGVDLAGAVVAKYLGIPALITLPRGFLQRFDDGKDIVQTQESVERQVDYWLKELEMVPATVPPPRKPARP